MTPEEIQFGLTLRETMEGHPEWLDTAMRAIHGGIQKSFQQAVADKIEWETVAINTAEARLFKGNKSWLAGKIERLAPRASMRWDHIIEALRK